MAEKKSTDVADEATITADVTPITPDYHAPLPKHDRSIPLPAPEVLAAASDADERLTGAEREELAEVAALVETATEGARQAATALHEARGAYRHVWGRIARRHAVTDRDGIDTATGAIARNRAPAPGPRG